MAENELVAGETVYAILKPHPLSFMHFYAFFAYYVAASALVLYKLDDIVASLMNSPIGAWFGMSGVEVIVLLLLWALLVIPAVIFSVLRIAWKWLIIFVLISSGLTYGFFRYSLSLRDLFILIAALGVLGIILSDLYRRGFTYTLTNFRIIASEGFIMKKTRDVFYNKLTDVFVIQGLLGKIFNYGTIVPITASGIGTGQDMAQVSVGAGGKATPPQAPVSVASGITVTGGKTVTVPRGRESFTLYGVSAPWDLRKLIIQLMRREDPVTYLQQVVDLLKKSVSESG